MTVGQISKSPVRLVVDVGYYGQAEAHLNFPGQDVHRVHFNPRGHPDELWSREMVPWKKNGRGGEHRHGLRARGW